MQLLKLLRRIVVLSVAVFGLIREMPYQTLAIRLAVLWAVLYIVSGLVDIVFRRLSHSAYMRQQQELSSETGDQPSSAAN